MEAKTYDLTGKALDHAVALCHGAVYQHYPTGPYYTWPTEPMTYSPGTPPYSSNWTVGGPVIEREKISVSNPNGDLGWSATISFPKKPKRNGTPQWGHFWELGPTPLIAAMRCYVTSKLGDTVDIPAHLLNK